MFDDDPGAPGEHACLQTVAQREAAILAPYAVHSAHSAGRKHFEPLHPYRGPFSRDRDRIIHSAAYRRLSYKTQVFTGDVGDYHRTRLTHTLEATSIARSLGRALRLNEDLIEALALAHDLGHPPFGHAGEDTLDECLRDEGGFSHNRHGLRILEELEIRYPDFPGLNLTLEVLAGQAARIDKSQPREHRPDLEAQVVDAADSVAYDTHDADDALEMKLLTLDELLQCRLWREAAQRVGRRYANLDRDELRHAVLHELIDWQVGDLMQQTALRLRQQGIDSLAAVRAAGTLIVASPEIVEQKAELERFLFRRVYRHPQILMVRTRAQQKLRAMFEHFSRQPEGMPISFQSRIESVGVARSVSDYLAGMTDRFAQREYERIFGA